MCNLALLEADDTIIFGAICGIGNTTDLGDHLGTY